MSFKTNLAILALSIQILTAYSQGVAFTEEEREAYETHKEEMAVPVEFLGADAFASIQAAYDVKPSVSKTLRTLCDRMEEHKYVHNYLVETLQTRLSHKRRIEALYWDSIAALLIPSNPDMAGRFLGYAIRLSPALRLAKDAESRLADNAIRIAQRLRTTPCASFAKEEMDSLKSLLSTEQIDKVLQAKNARMVNEKVRDVWKALESAGLTDGLDKDRDMKRAATFFMKETSIKDYYSDDDATLVANLDDLYRHKPNIVTMYEGLMQKDGIKKKHRQKVGAAFSW